MHCATGEPPRSAIVEKRKHFRSHKVFYLCKLNACKSLLEIARRDEDSRKKRKKTGGFDQNCQFETLESKKRDREETLGSWNRPHPWGTPKLWRSILGRINAERFVDRMQLVLGPHRY